ncbi:MAG: hypothetical protein HC828_12410 [Blastochloris sp.]|nr:hypothetical protein [Blastochloris sp.]
MQQNHCRRCGCTDRRACRLPPTDDAPVVLTDPARCYWVTPSLCSACADRPRRRRFRRPRLGHTKALAFRRWYQHRRERADDTSPPCAICGIEMEPVECFTCDGEGGRDADELMEEDPLWYDEIDWEDCEDCQGKGYFWQCPNLDCHMEVPHADGSQPVPVGLGGNQPTHSAGSRRLEM